MEIYGSVSEAGELGLSLVCCMHAYVYTSQCIPTQHKGGDKGRFALWSFWSTKLKGDKGCLIF